MSTMQMIYIGNFNDQQYDQHFYSLIWKEWTKVPTTHSH
jgi:hypothetical protein